MQANTPTDLGGFTAGGSLVLTNLGTAPSASVTDACLTYVADAAAGDAQLFARNEAGEVARLTGNTKVLGTQFDSTSTTAANVTGLGIKVEAGKTYAFRAMCFIAADATGGFTIGLGDAGGTLTATTFKSSTLTYGSSFLVGETRFTTLGNTVGAAGATSYDVWITGSITVNAAGTLSVIFAQAPGGSGTSSVLTGSSLQIWQV